MRSLIRQYRYFLFLVLIIILSEILVNPVGNFPLNDDWAYGKAVLYTIKDHYTIGDFGAMTLFTHLMWGVLFTKLFGFSFTVLRFSTLISVLIGTFFLYHLILKITGRQLSAFFLCLVLIFNPMYFNLANTFMTDVNFNTLLVLCCYSAFLFFESENTWYMLLFFLCSLALVLLRQYGLVAPICFTLACMPGNKGQRKHLLYACLGLAFVLISFKAYEHYLAGILPAGAAYKFSGNLDPLHATFWDKFFNYWNVRYKLNLMYVLIFTAPFAAFFIRPLSRSVKRYYLLGFMLLSFWLTRLLFDGQVFPEQNILTNMCLGPETFHEFKGHAHSELFAQICENVKYLLPFLTLLTLCMYGWSLLRGQRPLKIRRDVLFMLALLVAYTFMILITDSYFDRYHIPQITICLILFARLFGSQPLNHWFSAPLLLLFFYVSVSGTKDYLTLNRLRWRAFHDIQAGTKLPAGKINGGFEVNCWNDGKNNWWYDYADLKPFDYLIQFKKEEGFKLLRAYEFQRYLPYKKDTLNLYIREKKQNNQ